MAFSDTHSKVTAGIDALRAQMDHACRAGLNELATALFADNPDIGSVYWTQHFDPTVGFSLGSIHYTTVHVINARLYADQGNSSLVLFATFLRSIAYHLFCVHGGNVQITLSASGLQSAPIQAELIKARPNCKCS